METIRTPETAAERFKYYEDLKSLREQVWERALKKFDTPASVPEFETDGAEWFVERNNELRDALYAKYGDAVQTYAANHVLLGSTLTDTTIAEIPNKDFPGELNIKGHYEKLLSELNER